MYTCVMYIYSTCVSHSFFVIYVYIRVHVIHNLYVTGYGILDHILFFTKIEFLVLIDAQFIVDFNRA